MLQATNTIKNLPEGTPGDAEIAMKLGRKLRRTRLEKKLHLSAVADKLKISESQLKNLEKGNYESLPEMTYAIGFVSAYAEYLELPKQSILEDFRRGMGTPIQQSYASAITGALPKSRYSLFYLFVLAIFISICLYFVWLHYNIPQPVSLTHEHILLSHQSL